MIANLNFVDLIAVVLTLRFLYLGSINGVGAQVFPLLWVFVTFFLLIVFYPYVSLWLQSKFSFSISLSIFLSIVIIFLACFVLRMFLSGFFKSSTPAQVIKIEQYFGMFIAFVRAMLVIGIVCMFITSIPILEIEDKVETSFFAEKILVFDTKAVYALIERIPLEQDISISSDTALNGLFRRNDNSLSLVKVLHLQPVDRKKQ
ncbi:MAG: CvpA family protein [Candidatus Omnitrophica bacterium]|nr:CvpA family protein [Candidatus Omnitrophota bacterium]